MHCPRDGEEADKLGLITWLPVDAVHADEPLSVPTIEKYSIDTVISDGRGDST